MDNTIKKLRAVNFDLREADLKRYYSPTNPRGAYGRIASFFEKQGFEHRQYSGYTSKEPLSDIEIFQILNTLYNQFSWLDKCTEKMDITTIDSIYDFWEMRKSEKGYSHIKEEKKQSQKSQESLKDLIARKHEQAKELNESSHEIKEHSHDRNKDTIDRLKKRV